MCQFVWFPPPLCVGSALASACSSCSFCSAPPPRPLNTQAFAQLQANSRRNERVVTHLQQKHRAVGDDGMAWIETRQEKKIQTLCAVTQFHTDPSSAGMIATEDNKRQFSVIYLPDGLEELTCEMISSENITSGWLKKRSPINLQLWMWMTNGCRSCLEDLLLKLKNKNKPVRLSFFVNPILEAEAQCCFLQFQSVVWIFKPAIWCFLPGVGSVRGDMVRRWMIYKTVASSEESTAQIKTHVHP